MIIGLGVDIVELSRMKNVLRKHGERFYRRIYNRNERGEITGSLSNKENGDEVAENRTIMKAAGKFAAKEAFLKAIGTGLAMNISWKDIEVITDKKGAPKIAVYGRAAEIAEKYGIERIHVSISHSRQNAIAMVIAEDAL